jgi:thymidylate kinase
MNLEYCKKIVITGGPGGGKTTALDLFQRELNEKLAVVPEAASILFKGGMPRSDQLDVVKTTQKTIYQVQRSLENIQESLNPHKLLICDRGTLDGVAYWPGNEEDFFKEIESSFEEELDRYDAVIFFETAAQSGNEIDSNNPVRTESKQQAIDLDKKLKRIWSKHPNFHFVGSNESFVKKIMFGIMTIENVIGRNT